MSYWGSGRVSLEYVVRREKSRIFFEFATEILVVARGWPHIREMYVN